jgi:hypothetical protein
MQRIWMAGVSAALLFVAASEAGAQQPLPLEPVRPSGLPVSPVYEGWYSNPDGTYTLSFGYMNRNSEEVLEIPVGPSNRIEPLNSDQGQPTSFLPRRQYGVFTVTVPADFKDRDVVWTLEAHGQRFSIPGRIKQGYEIDALGAPATGVIPPVLRFAADGAEARGPKGITHGPLTASVGTPLQVSVWATDTGNRQVTLYISKFRGPGDVKFEPQRSRDGVTATIQVPRDAPAGLVSTTVSFTQPGEYVLHVRGNNSAVASAGHAQCCWTNGFIKVNVTSGSNSR